MCEYSTEFPEYSCKEDEYKDGYCIFHCDKENFTEKEIKEFNKKFWEEFERQEKDEKEFNFIGFKFHDKISFLGRKFEKKADFGGAKFGNLADFMCVKFIKGANFGGATFTERASFMIATFKGANFQDATFTKGANFTDATFIEQANFQDATFTKGANFTDAIFIEQANFQYATFTKWASFWHTTFIKEANFMWVVFNNPVKFIGDEDSWLFDLEIDYKKPLKKKSVTNDLKKIFDKNGFELFDKAKIIQKEDKLWNIIGEDRTYKIKETKEEDNTKLEVSENNKIFKSSADFSHSNFETPEKVEFVNVNLSKASFLHCKNIDKISRFEEVVWNSIGKRKAVFDEINAETDTYKFVAEIYRKLRLNYEQDLRFPEAGDFYIGEMEMRRKNAKFKNKYLDYSLISLYKIFSHYGENVVLPFLWMIPITFVFALYYTNFNSIAPVDFVFADVFKFLENWAKSIMILFQMPPEQMTFSIFIERILGVLFVALCVLALRRKFKKGGE